MNQITFKNGTIYPESIVTHEGATYFLVRLPGGGKQLVVRGDTAVFHGTSSDDGLIAPLTSANAAALRQRLPWLNPTPLGAQTSYGFGDRIGLATPGHVAAMRATEAVGRIAPIFAQQSVRENTRIGRNPQLVMDAATWGLLQTGWREPWGADADHVKQVSDLPPFVAAGYTFYTIDPSDHVDNEAQTDTVETLRRKAAQLPWQDLNTEYDAVYQTYCQAPFALDGLTLTFAEETLLRALVKYGRAVAHTAVITQALSAQMGGQPFDLEMSVDETDTPTSAHEHFFIANELLRREIPVVSLAPRFVGKFQKGVDYMGDPAEFAAELAKHAAIMRHFGQYKLSVHTGSDKFSIYDEINRQANGRVHVKTAGTSYLEALRALAQDHPTLFRQILTLAHERFSVDRKTYFLDCQPENVPHSPQLTDAQLPGLLDDFDARQLLHVTFGSALERYGASMLPALDEAETQYSAMLVRHFSRHLHPFL